MNKDINLYILRNSSYDKYDFDRDKFIIDCENYAREIASKYDKKFMDNFLSEHNFEFVYVENNSEYVTYRAQIEISDKSKRILIYEDIIEQDYHNLCKLGYDISSNTIKDMYIMHEFFHVLEYYEKINIVDHVDKIEYKGLFNKIKYKKNKISSEIGANYYSQYVLDLSFNPYLLELITNHDTIKGVLDEIQL